MMGVSPIALDRVARVPAKHALVYTRYLKASIDDVWSAISTAEGLSQWWVAPVTAFELKSGGAFNHHWNSLIVGFEDHRFIDFKKRSETSREEVMRFKISQDGKAQTKFTLLDSIEADIVAGDNEPQPHGPGTVWAGVAAGWHGAADALERLFEPDLPVQDWTGLVNFYETHLMEQFEFMDLVRRDD
ncbi:MAG: SRPBCC domain-containing protein [Pseudomonadota bacterium]